MKKLLLTVFLFFAYVQLACAVIADTATVREIINLVQKKHAPDKRSTFFKADIFSDNPLVLHVETTEPSALKELKSMLAAREIDATVNESLLPSNSSSHIYGIGKLSVGNNRFAPHNAAEMATQVLLGTPVKILKKERGYYLIRTPDNYLSWTDNAAIEAMDEKSYQSWQQAKKIVFTAMYGQSYTDPSEKSLPVSDLVAGNILRLISKKKRFYKVSYPDNRIAYIPVKNATDYTQWISRPDPDPEKILATAKSLVGIPYLWGGTSVKGMDCSGFTKISYFLNGIILQRDASQQVLYGTSVNIYKDDSVSIDKCLSNLQPGDLLFFTSGKNKIPDARITHTGIYIGDGKFIQAAGLVRINSLLSDSQDYDDYQTKRLVSARRVLTSIGTSGISRVDKHPFYSPLN